MTVTLRKLVILGVVGALVLGYILVDVLWLSDEEKLHRLVSRLEKAVEAHDAEACVALADEQSWDWLGTREELVELLRQLFTIYDPVQVRVVEEKVEPQPPKGTVQAITVVFLGSRSPFPGPVGNTWILSCTKRNGDWYISRAHVELEGGSMQTIASLVNRVKSLPQHLAPRR